MSYNVMLGIGVLVFVTLVIFGSIVLRRIGGERSRAALDERFGALNLTAEPYLSQGRHYFGDVNGREVHIYAHPLRRVRWLADIKLLSHYGYMCEYYVETNPLTRFALSSPNDIADPLDPTWAATMLADPDAQSAITQLFSSATPKTTTGIVLMPGVLRYARRALLDSMQPPETLEELVRLSIALEALPAPTITDALSELERSAISNRGNIFIELWRSLRY